MVSQWFDKKRSLANGIVSAGAGIGGIVFTFAEQAVIDQEGLGWALRMVGIVSGAANLVAVALMRSRNKEVKATIRGFDVALLKRESVLLLLAWAFTNMLGYVTPLYSLSAFAKDQLGLSNSQASTVTACLNVGAAVGRPLMGLVSDRYGRIEVAGVSTLFCSVFIFAIWIPSNSYGVLIFFATISGTILGVFWVVSVPLSYLDTRNCLTPANALQDCLTTLCRSCGAKRSQFTIGSDVDHHCSSMHMYVGKKGPTLKYG